MKDLSKALDRLVQGVTSSSSKKKVIKQRIEELINNTKTYWYKRLLEKLRKIESGELSLSDYIEEVTEKSK